MNLKAAARRLGIHYQTAYRYVRAGELIAIKVGTGYEISEAALQRFCRPPVAWDHFEVSSASLMGPPVRQ